MKRTLSVIGVAVLAGVTVLLAGERTVRESVPPVSFARAINLPSPVLYPSSLSAGDLDHDGIPDLAVISPDNTTPLEYAQGKGNGHFGPWRQNDNVGYAPRFVLLADVDGDGNLDAITTDVLGSDIYLAFGDGKGHLNGGKSLPVEGVNSTYFAAVADLNGDGIPDIVGTSNNGIFVILGKGNRKFAKAKQFSSGGQQPYGIAVGDLNHDGIPDLVVANYGTEQNGDYGNVAVLLGKGDGTFHSPVPYPVGKYQDPLWLVLGDFRRDGNLDVAVTTQNSNAVHVFIGRGDGTLSSPRSFPAGPGPLSLAIADFNGDGIPDLAVADYNTPAYVSVLLGEGDGTFRLPRKFGVDATAQLVVADFNHDGRPDIATIGTATNEQSYISILVNTTPWPSSRPSAPGSRPPVAQVRVRSVDANLGPTILSPRRP